MSMITTTSNVSTNPIRIYFTNITLVNNSALFRALHLIEKTSVTRLYSNEGIFNIQDNKITRVKIQDQPAEPLTVHTIDFLVDKSSITDDTEWYQLSPQHIIETISVYTYACADACADTLQINKNRINLIVEKHDEQIRAVYFQIDKEYFSKDDVNNRLVTFLSTLNLC